MTMDEESREMQEWIENKRKEAKRQAEELNREREKQRKEEELREKMKIEAEYNKWKTVIEQETRYFNPKQKKLFQEICSIINKQHISPSDFSFYLQEGKANDQVRLQLLSLWKEILDDYATLPEEVLSEKHWYQGLKVQLIPKETGEYEVKGLGVEAQLIMENGEPKEIVMKIPFRLLEGMYIKAKIPLRLIKDTK